LIEIRTTLRTTPKKVAMNTSRPALRHSLLFAALLCASMLSACSDKASSGTDPGEPTTLIGKAVKEAADEGRKGLATANIQVSKNQQPKAEITPQGDLLIDGKQITATTEQRKLLLEYRGHITGIAEAGIGIGLQGADLAGKAVGEALKGVLTGNTDQIGQKIEAEAEGIEKAAVKLCKLLPAMKVTQDKLALAMPEFKPYATMDQSDVDDCGKDGKFNVDIDIPGGAINSDIDVSSGKDSENTAAEAEAATAEPAK
jgi:Protein of unknown function (DUF2884)